MNRLDLDTQTTVIAALTEGASIRSVERMTGVHRDTIMRLMVRVGHACDAWMDDHLRDLPCEADRSGYAVGLRRQEGPGGPGGRLVDLSARLANRVQIDSDGLRLYAEAIEAGFGGNVDWSTIVKSYETDRLMRVGTARPRSSR